MVTAGWEQACCLWPALPTHQAHSGVCNGLLGTPPSRELIKDKDPRLSFTRLGGPWELVGSTGLTLHTCSLSPPFCMVLTPQWGPLPWACAGLGHIPQFWPVLLGDHPCGFGQMTSPGQGASSYLWRGGSSMFQEAVGQDVLLPCLGPG
jgi:hypothetical protein